MKKFGAFLALICVLNLLSLAGLAAYLVLTGRLDRPKAAAVLDVLRHRGTPVNFREQVYDILQPTPAKAAATGPATRPILAEGAPATAQERIDFAHAAMEQERLRLENEAQDLRHRQELLVQLQAQVELKLKKIDDEKKAFAQEVARAGAREKSESFQKTMALYDELKPKQLKDLFMTMPEDVVVGYLGAMAPDRAAAIVSEFKTAPERAFLQSVLERLRSGGTPSASGTSTASNTPR